MKKFIRLIFSMAIILGLFGSLPVYAAETQFSSFVSERNVPVGDNWSKDSPARLINVPYGELPQDLKSSFECLIYFKGDGAMMTLEELDKLTFTGPYYEYFLNSDKIDTPDPDKFRKAIEPIPRLIYIVRMEGYSPGIISVVFVNGKYEWSNTGESGAAIPIIEELDAVSDSEGLAEDVFFLRIRTDLYIVNKDDRIYYFSSWWKTNDNLYFTDLVKAEYLHQKENAERLAEYERKGEEPPAIGGGVSLEEYINNLNLYFDDSTNTAINPHAAKNISVLPWVAGVGVLIVTGVTFIIILIKKKRCSPNSR